MKTHRLETSIHQIGKLNHPAHRTDRALRSALELRYQVYCVECSFLSPDDYPQGLESDEHDDAAQHFFAYDLDDELVGYVRLVLPNDEERFPFQNHCATFTDGAKLPVPGRAAEISRLMLRSDYRRLPDRGLAALAPGLPPAAFSGDRRDQATHVLLSLYRQVYSYSRDHGIDHWYAAMERPLARSLLRMNISFKEIGPVTDYYGPVAPYLAHLHEVESQVAASNPALLAWLQQPESDLERAGCVHKTGFATIRACR